MSVLGAVFLMVAAIAATEVFAILLHRYVMHGPGWFIHRTHHEPREGYFELNDLYALVFALLAIGLFLASMAWGPAFWLGVGVTLYGVLYALAHDGLVHRRIPLNIVPRRGYLKRLVQAHNLHHAVKTRDGAVSFGFLWAPDAARLKRRLAAQKTQGEP